MATDTHPDVEPILHALITSDVNVATHYYRIGQPGGGAYELARLAIRVNRLLETEGEHECKPTTTWHA